MQQRQRAVVIGSDRVGLRVAQRLEADGHAVTVVALPGSWLAEARLPPTWRVARARPETEVLMEDAGLGEAVALLAVSEADEVNLGAALAAREACPGVRLVVRQFNTRLAPILAHHLPEAQILSLSALAAPTFALSALTPGVVFAQPLGEETLVLRELAPGDPVPEDAVPLVAATGDAVVPLGAGEEAPPASRRLVASTSRELPPHPRGTGGPLPPAAPPPAEDGESRRLLAATVASVAALLLCVSALYVWRLGLAPLDALYFVSTILTTVGFGDFNLRNADPLSKWIGIATMYGGLFLTALLVGLLTSRLMARREARRRGHFQQRLSGHVVVCGLGTLGLRVAEDLRRRGVEVVAVDPAPRPRLLALARAIGVQVVEADATEERALAFAGLPRAGALVAATDRDHVNLEIVLVARSLSPGIPTTVRLFDADLGRRVRETFGVQSTHSSASLTAGRFSSLLEGATRLAEVSFAGRVLELVAVPGPGEVGPLAAARGGRAVAVEAPGAGLLLGPPPERSLVEGETLVLLVARP